MEQSRAALQQEETNLQYTRILSPVDGVVISRNVDIGQTVAASFQTPTLFSIAQDLTRMQIDTNVDEADIGRVAVGQAVSFTVDAYPDTTFPGKVSEIRNAPTTVQNVVTYDVVIKVANPERKLKPGMTANVSIITAQEQAVLKIPNAALRFKWTPDKAPEQGKGGASAKGPAAAGEANGQKRQGVWILEGQKPRRIPITVGISDGSYTAVSSGGLKEGDAVIVEATGAAKKDGTADRPEGILLSRSAMELIETHHLTKIYELGDSTVHALDDVSLTIGKGEFVAVMGPSGSGKSTFMNVIGCLDEPTGGQYLLDGIDIGHRDHDELAEIRNKKIGFVFQGFNLLPRTSALENVELPMLYNGFHPRERRQRAMEALKAMGLEGREDHHPNQLSGGQQQRVAIARALVNRAPLILADEPTGNLDTHSSVEIMELFVKLNRESGITIILVTHEPDIAAFSRRIVRFRDGRIVSDEPVKPQETKPAQVAL